MRFSSYIGFSFVFSTQCDILTHLIIPNTGQDLYDSATRLRLPELPAFALECLPNRNSLLYGDLYGIASEASTVFRGTLRYEGTIYKCFCYFSG